MGDSGFTTQKSKRRTSYQTSTELVIVKLLPRCVTYLKNSLVQLHHGNRLPETRILAVAKMRVHGVRHLFESLFRGVEPPLWAKDVGVRAPDGL